MPQPLRGPHLQIRGDLVGGRVEAVAVLHLVLEVEGVLPGEVVVLKQGVDGLALLLGDVFGVVKDIARRLLKQRAEHLLLSPGQR